MMRDYWTISEAKGIGRELIAEFEPPDPVGEYTLGTIAAIVGEEWAPWGERKIAAVAFAYNCFVYDVDVFEEEIAEEVGADREEIVHGREVLWDKRGVWAQRSSSSDRTRVEERR